MNTDHKPNTLTIQDIAPLVGLNADRWLPIAQRIADNHPECVQALKAQAYGKFSGYDLEKVLHKLDQCAAVPGLERLYGMLRSGTPLGSTVLKITENIANAEQIEECPQANTIAGDPELARLAVALKLSLQYRVYLVMLQMVRETNVNHVLRADLAAKLSEIGINVTEGARRWLYRGNGIFWTLDETHVYLIGQIDVALKLVEMAVEHNLTDLIGTNRPGKRNVYIDVSGSLQQFEANVYAAWMAYRENPHIARATLKALWNREPRIQRKWEKLAAVDPHQ